MSKTSERPGGEASAGSVDVFFYGLFMDVEALRVRGLDPTNVRRAQVRGMALRLGRRAALAPEPGAVAHGFVMALTAAELEELYAEPSVADYRAERVIAETEDGKRLAALCYNLQAPPGPDERNPDYAEKLRALGVRLGLPKDYLRRIG